MKQRQCVDSQKPWLSALRQQSSHSFFILLFLVIFTIAHCCMICVVSILFIYDCNFIRVSDYRMCSKLPTVRMFKVLVYFASIFIPIRVSQSKDMRVRKSSVTFRKYDMSYDAHVGVYRSVTFDMMISRYNISK